MKIETTITQKVVWHIPDPKKRVVHDDGTKILVTFEKQNPPSFTLNVVPPENYATDGVGWTDASIDALIDAKLPLAGTVLPEPVTTPQPAQ